MDFVSLSRKYIYLLHLLWCLGDRISELPEPIWMILSALESSNYILYKKIKVEQKYFSKIFLRFFFKNDF